MSKEKTAADVISKKDLMEILRITYKNRYQMFPEGERSEEDYKERVLKGKGFLDAMQIVDTYNAS